MASDRSLSASASAPTLPPSAPPRAQTPDTRGSAGSGPARPRTSGTSSTFAQRNRGLGTRSTFGRQVLGGRTSEPSFSFGSAPARVALPAGSQRKGAELQPSVAVSSQKNPGPIYNPKGHKPMGDGPRHVFGTEVRASRTLALALALRLTTPTSTLTRRSGHQRRPTARSPRLRGCRCRLAPAPTRCRAPSGHSTSLCFNTCPVWLASMMLLPRGWWRLRAARGSAWRCKEPGGESSLAAKGAWR